MEKNNVENNIKIYTRISLLEREIIYKLHLEKKSQTEISQITGRNKSSICRELLRCKDSDLGYVPDRADEQAKQNKRQRNGGNTGLFRSEKIFLLVEKKLKLGWSPEQIAGRLKLEKNPLQISYETIYKFAYSKAGKALGWPKLLPRKQPTRRKKLDRKPKKEIIPNLIPISNRPTIIDGRSEIGHWEGDLVIFTSFKSNNLTTLVERKSRFAKLVCNYGKTTATVVKGIDNVFKTMPKTSVESITFDRGTEFCSYEKLGIKTYFCEPHSPWQKGGVENFNGRIRRFLPKSFDHKLLNQNLVNTIENTMNNCPRKCLDFRTPFEVFYNTKITDFVALVS
jgi:transposase, IS30 family